MVRFQESKLPNCAQITLNPVAKGNETKICHTPIHYRKYVNLGLVILLLLFSVMTNYKMVLINFSQLHYLLTTFEAHVPPVKVYYLVHKLGLKS